MQRTIFWPTVRAHAHVTPEIIQTLSHDYKLIYLIVLDNIIKLNGICKQIIPGLGGF